MTPRPAHPHAGCGSGRVVNILTLIALAPVGPMAGYSASKAAAHSITQALRAELRDRGSPCSAPIPAA